MNFEQKGALAIEGERQIPEIVSTDSQVSLLFSVIIPGRTIDQLDLHEGGIVYSI